MKKFSILLLSFVALTAVVSSCNKNGADDNNKVNQDSINNIAVNDSLATVRAEKDSLAALMTEVSDGMTEIMDMQQLVTAANLDIESRDRKAEMRSNIEAIKNAIQNRITRLRQLEDRLRQSTTYSDEMKRSIVSLKKQLDKQQSIIADLNGKLATAQATITHLNTSVDSLKTENKVVTREKIKAQEESNRLTNEVNNLNECFYVVGTKKELKQQKIIETGFLRKTKVMEGDYTKSYFTKADKRTLNTIALHSKKAQVMSKHPSDSYAIEDAGGQKVLHILNPNRFWELSNYLVVKID
jgi:chromosome segregation ATPase